MAGNRRHRGGPACRLSKVRRRGSRRVRSSGSILFHGCGTVTFIGITRSSRTSRFRQTRPRPGVLWAKSNSTCATFPAQCIRVDITAAWPKKRLARCNQWERAGEALSRTPNPKFRSASKNKTPAFSSACWIRTSVATLPAGDSKTSILRTVAIPISAAFARSSWRHPSSARAARI